MKLARQMAVKLFFVLPSTIISFWFLCTSIYWVVGNLVRSNRCCMKRLGIPYKWRQYIISLMCSCIYVMNTIAFHQSTTSTLISTIYSAAIFSVPWTILAQVKPPLITLYIHHFRSCFTDEIWFRRVIITHSHTAYQLRVVKIIGFCLSSARYI